MHSSFSHLAKKWWIRPIDPLCGTLSRHHPNPNTFTKLRLPIPSQSTNRELSTMVSEIRRFVSNQALELKFFEEIPAPRVRSVDAVDAIVAWQSTDEGPVEMCYFFKDRGELFYIDDSSGRLLLRGVDVTTVVSSWMALLSHRRETFSESRINSSVCCRDYTLFQHLPTTNALYVISYHL